MKRREQNRALREWDNLKKLVGAIDPFVTAIIARAAHSSGQRRAVRSTDKESRVSPPYYGDPTGETAISDEIADTTSIQIEAMVYHMRQAFNLGTAVLSITPVDAAERARREVPDCEACGNPVHGRPKAGYGEDCYKAWQRAGYPDRQQFKVARRKRLAEAKKADG